SAQYLAVSSSLARNSISAISLRVLKISRMALAGVSPQPQTPTNSTREPRIVFALFMRRSPASLALRRPVQVVKKLLAAGDAVDVPADPSRVAVGGGAVLRAVGLSQPLLVARGAQRQGPALVLHGAGAPFQRFEPGPRRVHRRPVLNGVQDLARLLQD